MGRQSGRNANIQVNDRLSNGVIGSARAELTSYPIFCFLLQLRLQHLYSVAAERLRPAHCDVISDHVTFTAPQDLFLD